MIELRKVSKVYDDGAAVCRALQDFALIERYTVEKNVMLPLYYSKKYKKNKKQRVEEVLKSLGIWEKRNWYGASPEDRDRGWPLPEHW